MRRWLRAIACALSFCSAVLGCEPRSIAPREASWSDVEPVLSDACASCHSASVAEGGYRVDGYPRAIACPESAETTRVVEPADASAPLLAVLAREDHAALLDERERALLEAWVTLGAPSATGAVHPAGWIDPRSSAFHGAALRAEGWARLFEHEGPSACARCHAGVTADDETPGTAPGATACTSCHEQGEGPLGCDTCHGDEGRAYPPRDPCSHPEERERGGAHAAHASAGVGCEVCHGARDADGLRMPERSHHGDGAIDIALDEALAGEGASFDPDSRTCARTCHDRGGALATPEWQSGSGLDCASCHQSPPADHYAGECRTCHVEVGDDGASLLGGPLHLNGRIDIGDGSGGCGACHGEGEDPNPRTGAHSAHGAPRLATSIPCAECHVMPSTVLEAGHLDDTVGAEVVLGARAQARGVMPRYASGTCSEVACHGAGLGGATFTTPRWDATDGRAARCGACHGAPPPMPHPERDGCSAVGCHGAYATPGPGVSELGRTVHTDGSIDLWRP